MPCERRPFSCHVLWARRRFLPGAAICSPLCSLSPLDGHGLRLATGAWLRQAVSLQVVGKGLGNMPVIPELRLAPRLAWPWIPGRAARTGTADPGLPLGCPFFHRQMCRDAARAGVGGCLHEFTPPQRVRPGVLVLVPPARLQTAASGAGGPLLRGQSATAGGSNSPDIDHVPPRITATRRACHQIKLRTGPCGRCSS